MEIDKDKLENVLAECNKVRARRGLKPAPNLKMGLRFNPNQCPIAKTIGGRAFLNTYTGVEFPGGKCIPNALLQEFGSDFDLGKYPELDLESRRDGR